MNETPLEHLRRVTAEKHERVEELTNRLGVLRSRDKFTRHLMLLWQHHHDELQRLREHNDLHSRVEHRVAELAHDILHLGGTLPQVPVLTARPSTFPNAIGATYVIEGSRLGAYAIARILTKNGISTDGLVSVGGDLTAIRQSFQVLASRINDVTQAEVKDMAHAAITSFTNLLRAYESWSEVAENQA